MRKLFLAVLSFTVVLLIGFAAYRSFGNAKQNYLLSKARQYMAQSDSPNAVLFLSEVLRLNPGNIEATRLMARLAEAGQLPSALSWRNRLIEIDPHSLEDRIELAATALRMGVLPLARRSLEGADPDDKRTASYQNAAGTLALSAGQPDQAEAFFREAARLDPQNPVSQLNLAVVRLHSTNPRTVVEARRALGKLAGNPASSAIRCQALRELTADAFDQKFLDYAQVLSLRLLAESNSVFSDRLLRLDILRQTNAVEFTAALAAVQTEALTDPTKIYQLAMWEMLRISPRETLAWLGSLPAKDQARQPVQLMSAECRTLLKDWPGLQASLGQQDWAALEFVRHAFEACAFRGQELHDQAVPAWEEALRSAGKEKGNLIMLFNLATQFNWLNERGEVLSAIIKQYPEEEWARRELKEVGQPQSL